MNWGNKTLKELKKYCKDAEIDMDDIAMHGPLNKKSTWVKACKEHYHRNGFSQKTIMQGMKVRANLSRHRGYRLIVYDGDGDELIKYNRRTNSIDEVAKVLNSIEAEGADLKVEVRGSSLMAELQEALREGVKASEIPKDTRRGRIPLIGVVTSTHPNMQSFTGMAQLAGITDELLNPDLNAIVFVPADEAFEELPPEMVQYLAGRPELLKAILLNHVVPMTAGVGKGFLASISGDELTTLAGDTIEINSEDIVESDIVANNGIVHIIDTIYMPESVGFDFTPSKAYRRNPSCYCMETGCGTCYTATPSWSDNYMVPRDIHEIVQAADRLEEMWNSGTEYPEWWKSKLSVAADRVDGLADAAEYIDEYGGHARNNPGTCQNCSTETSMLQPLMHPTRGEEMLCEGCYDFNLPLVRRNGKSDFIKKGAMRAKDYIIEHEDSLRRATAHGMRKGADMFEPRQNGKAKMVTLELDGVKLTIPEKFKNNRERVVKVSGDFGKALKFYAGVQEGGWFRYWDGEKEETWRSQQGSSRGSNTNYEKYLADGGKLSEDDFNRIVAIMDGWANRKISAPDTTTRRNGKMGNLAHDYIEAVADSEEEFDMMMEELKDGVLDLPPVQMMQKAVEKSRKYAEHEAHHVREYIPDVMRSNPSMNYEHKNKNYAEQNLENADFSNAVLRNTMFYGANLKNADFSGSIFMGTIFDEADTTGANFDNAIIVEEGITYPPELENKARRISMAEFHNTFDEHRDELRELEDYDIRDDPEMAEFMRSNPSVWADVKNEQLGPNHTLSTSDNSRWEAASLEINLPGLKNPRKLRMVKFNNFNNPSASGWSVYYAPITNYQPSNSRPFTLRSNDDQRSMVSLRRFPKNHEAFNEMTGWGTAADMEFLKDLGLYPTDGAIFTFMNSDRKSYRGPMWLQAWNWMIEQPNVRRNPMPEGKTFMEWASEEDHGHPDMTFREWAKEEADEYASQQDHHEQQYHDDFMRWADSEINEETHSMRRNPQFELDAEFTLNDPRRPNWMFDTINEQLEEGEDIDHWEITPKHTESRSNPRMPLDGMEEKRKKMPAKDFALPKERKFPMNTKAQAMRALTFAEWPNNKKEGPAVRKAVFKKYPDLISEFKDGHYKGHYGARKNPDNLQEFAKVAKKSAKNRRILATQHNCPIEIVDEIHRYYNDYATDNDKAVALELYQEWC